MKNIEPSFLAFFNSDNIAVNELLKTNDASIEYGLRLTQKEAIALIQSKNEILRSYGRVEIGAGIVGKLAEKFCDSAYLQQDDYVSSLCDLIEIFYYIKNESLDQISDDELIDLMKNYYENTCRGSLDLLMGRELELVARNIRFSRSDYTDIGYDNKFFDEEDFYE